MTLCQQKDEEMLHQEKRTWKVHLKETDERNGNSKKWGTEAGGPRCSLRGLVRGSLTLAIYSGNLLWQFCHPDKVLTESKLDGIDPMKNASHEKWASSLLLKGADSEVGVNLFS